MMHPNEVRVVFFDAEHKPYIDCPEAEALLFTAQHTPAHEEALQVQAKRQLEHFSEA